MAINVTTALTYGLISSSVHYGFFFLLRLLFRLNQIMLVKLTKFALSFPYLSFFCRNFRRRIYTKVVFTWKQPAFLVGMPRSGLPVKSRLRVRRASPPKRDLAIDYPKSRIVCMHNYLLNYNTSS